MSSSQFFFSLFSSLPPSSVLGAVVLCAGRPLWQNAGIATSKTACAATVCIGALYIFSFFFSFLLPFVSTRRRCVVCWPPSLEERRRCRVFVRGDGGRYGSGF